VTVTGDDDVVADVVLLEMVQCAVAVGLVAVPGVVVEGVDVAVGDGLVDTGEDGLGADDSPAGAAVGGGGELVVEPACNVSQGLFL
jgi:hypothetical protein